MEVTEIRGLWRDAMRSIIGITLLVAAGLLGSRSDKPLKSLYLLAATPTAYRSATYPATLYSIGEKQKLHLLRTVVPGTDGVEFVLSSSNFLVIGHPTVSAKTVTFVHFGAPLIPDAIRIWARVKSGALGAFLIDGIGSDPTVGLTCFQNGSPCFSGVHVQPISEGDRRLVESLGWSRLEDIWFGGSIGGADIGFGTTEPTLGSQGLYVYSPQGIAFIARLKTPIITEPEIPAQLLCSNDQFVVASRNKVDSSNPKSTRLWIYNRDLQTASGLQVPGDRNRYRIFGRRLAVIISHSGDSPTSGSETDKAMDGSRIVTRSETSGAFDPGEDQQRPDLFDPHLTWQIWRFSFTG